MTAFPDSLSMDGATAALLFLPVGLVLGLAFFLSLRSNTRLYIEGGRIGTAIAIHLARIIGAGIAFFLISTQGAGALIGAFAGFLLARLTVTRPARKRS